MARLPLSNKSWSFLSALLIASSLTPPAQAVDLNYESLSSLEEPIAFELGDATLALNGLIDAASSIADKAEDDSFLRGNFQLSIETQLRNSWTLGASYFGSYSGADPIEDSYQDNAALFLGGVWGTLAAGNVTGLVREQTRRRRGVGNADLSLDDSLAQLGDDGVSYLLRLGPSQLVVAADDDGNFEIGSSYQRPLGNRDYRFSIRFRDAEFGEEDEFNGVSSQGLAFVSELTYGSMVLDLGLGFERLDFNQSDADRIYASLGAARKWGAWTASAEAHLGETDGDNETAYALGLRYDLARGLSLNLGINHTDAKIQLGDVLVIDNDDTVGTLSARYSF